MTVDRRDRALALGWDREWARWSDRVLGDPARVSRVDRGRVWVLHHDGSQSWVPAPSGGTAPVTGDWVTCSVDDGQGTLLAIADRRTALVRLDPADASEGRSTHRGDGPRSQTLAANMDAVWIVHSVDQPLRAGWLDRALVVAFSSGAQPYIVIAKTDLGGGGESASIATALAPAVPLVTTSSATGHGLQQLAAHLRDGRCAALLGRSGSGKSSLINALVGVSTQRTAAVRATDARGRHTTTRRSLTLVAGGSAIDTPGIRALGLWKPAAGLELTFPDIGDLGRHCRFANCTHRREPGCAVRDAIDNGRLASERYERYLTLSE